VIPLVHNCEVAGATAVEEDAETAPPFVGISARAGEAAITKEIAITASQDAIRREDMRLSRKS